MKKFFNIYICVMLFILFIPPTLFAQEEGIVNSIMGEVYYKEFEEDDYTRIRGGKTFEEGCFISTSENGQVEIGLPGGSNIKVFEETEINFQGLDENTIDIFVVAGEIFADVEKLTNSQVFTVSGPSVNAGVRGTSFLLSSTGGVSVLEGIVAVFNPAFPDQVTEVKEGQKIQVDPEQAVDDTLVQEMTEEEKEELQDKTKFSTEEDSEENNEEEKDTEEKTADTNFDYIEIPTVEDLNPKDVKTPASDESGESGGLDLPFDLGMFLGPTSLEEETGGYNVYTQTTVLMDFKFGPVGLGMIVPVFFDSSAPFDISKWANAAEWNFEDPLGTFYSLMSKIMYVTFNDKGQPVWFKFGTIDNMTFATGFVVDNYSNALTFPSKREFGIMFGLDSGNFGIESMVSNFSNFSIIGIRPYFRPISFLQTLTAGISFIGDLNSSVSSDTTESDQLLYMDGNNLKVFYLSANIIFDIITATISPLTISAYADFSKSFYQGLNPDTGKVFGWGDVILLHLFNFTDRPWGFSIGVHGVIAYIVDYKLEYLNLQNGFVPRYFDRFYDVQRLNPDKYQLITQPTTNAFNGIRAKAGGSFDINSKMEDKTSFSLDFTALFEDLTRNYLDISLYIEEGLIPKFFGLIEYHRKDIASIDEMIESPLNENTILSAELIYSFSPELKLSVFFTRVFTLADDGTIVPSDSFGFETKFQL